VNSEIAKLSDATSDWPRAWVLYDGDADPRPIRLTHVVDRQGGSASVMRHAGEEPALGGPEGQGRLVDVCRRALGLTTAPPPEESTGLWALLWLDGLLARAARGEKLAGLVAAARAHPAIEMVAEREPELVEEAAHRLVRLGLLFGQARNWSHLRRAAAAGTWTVEDLDADGAAWMDDGMFARWVTADFPLLDEYLVELDALLSEHVMAGIRGVLAQWELLAE